jgi:hypothetical protein
VSAVLAKRMHAGLVIERQGIGVSRQKVPDDPRFFWANNGKREAMTARACC